MKSDWSNTLQKSTCFAKQHDPQQNKEKEHSQGFKGPEGGGVSRNPPPPNRGLVMDTQPPAGAFCGILMKRFFKRRERRGKKTCIWPQMGKIIMKKIRKIGFDCRPHNCGLISTKLNHPCTFFYCQRNVPKKLMGVSCHQNYQIGYFYFSLCSFEGYLSCGDLITTQEMKGISHLLMEKVGVHFECTF